jgi:hypothetical protein
VVPVSRITHVRVYDGGRGEAPSALRDYAAGLGGYRKNSFSDLAPELKRRVAEAWADSFAEFGYET